MEIRFTTKKRLSSRTVRAIESELARIPSVISHSFVTGQEPIRLNYFRDFFRDTDSERTHYYSIKSGRADPMPIYSAINRWGVTMLRDRLILNEPKEEQPGDIKQQR